MSLKEEFRYDYDAKKHEEIRRIRDKYIPKEEDKLKMLRQLDKSVTRKGILWFVLCATLGGLMLLGGLVIALLWSETQLKNGIICAVCGILLIGGAFPLYIAITARQKKRIAPKILALTEELLKK